MTPSEALAAWVDSKRVEILRAGEWFPVEFFTLTQSGLNVTYNNSIQFVHAGAWGSEFRLADAPAEPKPTVEDSDDAWVLLSTLENALSRQKQDGKPMRYSITLNAMRRRVRDALKKRGML